MSTAIAKSSGASLKGLFNKILGQPSLYERKQNYTFGKTLGAGLFGIVRYARDNETGEEVAIKIILKKALDNQKVSQNMIIDELHLLQELLHPHIVGFRDWFELKDKFYIVTQLATGGELFDRIVERGHFSEHDASMVILQMLEAIEYLHEKNIVHRDIKPENVLYLTPEPNLNIVLADFGIAKKLNDSHQKLHSLAGLFGYAAPEVIMGTGHGFPCDIWSLGVVTYTLLCGYSPFRLEDVQDFIAEVKYNNAVIFHADYWKDVLKEARRFIIKALQFNPDDRPSAKELLNDVWLVLIAKEHGDSDLLPQIKLRFDAKGKFRQAIEIVKMNNRIKHLKELCSEDDDDPNEIDLFNDNGLVLATEIANNEEKAEEKSNKPLPFNLKLLSNVLKTVDSHLVSLLTPMANNKAPSSTTTPDKKLAAQNAFVQLVHAASENKERVATFNENSNDDDKKENA